MLQYRILHLCGYCISFCLQKPFDYILPVFHTRISTQFIIFQEVVHFVKKKVSEYFLTNSSMKWVWNKRRRYLWLVSISFLIETPLDICINSLCNIVFSRINLWFGKLICLLVSVWNFAVKASRWVYISFLSLNQEGSIINPSVTIKLLFFYISSKTVKYNRRQHNTFLYQIRTFDW